MSELVRHAGAPDHGSTGGHLRPGAGMARPGRVFDR